MALEASELFPVAILKLLWLKYKNFKGIKEFVFTLDGKNVNVYGDNATCKTTLFDGFNWLMFDKDSQGKSNFEIKTQDATGNAIHFLDHEVEAALERNGKVIVLRKVYAEKWTKKKGSASKEFTGHETTYWIDGVPVKKAEFTAMVNSIASEETFKLLTNPFYFNEMPDSPKLPGWKKKRNILFDACGANMSDADVIASDDKLAKLPEILGGRSADDHKKVIAARKTELNNQIEKLPIRIDEVFRGLPEITGLDADKLQAAIAVLKQTKTNLQEQLLQVQSGGEIARKKVELQGIEAELLRLKNEHQAAIDEKLSVKRKALNDATAKCNQITNELLGIENLMKSNQRQIDSLNNKREALRNKWHEVNKKEFGAFHAPEQQSTCPACGQDIPEHKVQEALEKAQEAWKKLEEAFNLDKAEQLESISADGKAIATEITEFGHQNVNYGAKVVDLKSRLEEAEQEVTRLRAEVESIQNTCLPVENTPEYAKKLQEKAAVESAIASLQAGNGEAAGNIKREIAEVDQEIQSNEIFLKQIDDYNKGQVRIKELKAEEKRLAAEYERLEGELFLIEQFIKTKVKLLEEKINSRFKYTRFKLFKDQINGGVEECCEALVNTNGAWVPYSTANNAGRIASGLDIIDTLSEHYGFVPPVFIDNKEGISVLPEIKSQVIGLIKPPSFDELDKDIRDLLIKEHGSEDKARREYNLKNQKLRVEVA